MKLRRFEQGDIVGLTHLMTQLGYPSSSSQLQNWFKKLLKLPNYHIIIAELEGEVVGFVGFMKQWAFEFDEPYIK